MDDKHPEIREEQIRKWSQEFGYPQTPDITDTVIRRIEGEAKPAPRLRPRLAWGFAIILLLLAALMAVPPVRAQILEYLQIGAIRIFLAEPKPTVTQESTLPSSLAVETDSLDPTNTPRPYPSIVDLAGETTLSEAKRELNFPIQLPTYPSDLGEPDRVFLQDLGGQAVLLVWMDPFEPDLIRLDLLLMGPGTFAEKGMPLVIEETTVNDQRALWTEGSHFLHLGGSMYQGVPLVIEGNILIWEQDGVTYRLESGLTLDEAVMVAESLK
jgi:hypothetical protein